MNATEERSRQSENCIGGDILRQGGVCNAKKKSYIVTPYTKSIASFIVSENDLLRERSANALGRIGRADFNLVAPYLKKLFILTRDENPNVRLSFIWASENIATNTPTVYEKYLPIFAELLNDENEKVRIEAPEMFRVLGKRKPEFVLPYLEKLNYIATHDEVSVVRIHAKGAIKATLSNVTKESDALDAETTNLSNDGGIKWTY